jgi:hypothetical protein
VNNHSDGGGSNVARSVGQYLAHCTELQPRRQPLIQFAVSMSCVRMSTFAYNQFFREIFSGKKLWFMLVQTLYLLILHNFKSVDDV